MNRMNMHQFTDVTVDVLLLNILFFSTSPRSPVEPVLCRLPEARPAEDGSSCPDGARGPPIHSRINQHQR